MMDLYDLLRGRYPAPEWAMFHEVNVGRGYGDAVVINMWSSRGYAVHGFERKDFRSDWLRELKQPQKAESLFQYCDYWWLLTSENNVAKIEEIPIGWGWVTAKGEKLKTMVAAPKLEPKPLSRHFIAAVLRRAGEQINKMIHPNDIQSRIDEARLSGEKIAEHSKTQELFNLREIGKDVEEFEKASGIKIHEKWDYRHDPKKLGEAIKYILDGGLEKNKAELLALKVKCERISKMIEEALDYETI